MTLEDKRSNCDECGQETNEDAMRYFSCDTHICNFCLFPFLDNYRKLLAFVKSIQCKLQNKHCDKSILCKANDLLREIGEIK